MKIKMSLIGTSLGRFLLRLREKYDLLKRVWILKPRSVTIFNDQLATFFVTHLCKDESVFLDIGAHITLLRQTGQVDFLKIVKNL